MDEIERAHSDQSQALTFGEDGGSRRQETLDVMPEEVPHLLDYWHLIIKRRWTVLSCLLIVTATVAIGTLKQKPVYAGKVLVEINPEQPNVLNFKEILQIDNADVDSYRETQYKILESRTLAERVVKDLKLYLYPEFYRNRSLLGLLESDPHKIPSTSDPGPPDPSTDAYGNSIRQFMGSIDVSPVRRSNLVEISLESRDPQLAARAANMLATDYIEQNLQVKWDATLRASEWLSGQLVGLKGKLEKSEDALQSYAQANSILFITEKQNLVNARLEQLQEGFTKAQAERFQKEALYGLVQAGNGSGRESPGLAWFSFQQADSRLSDAAGGGRTRLLAIDGHGQAQLPHGGGSQEANRYFTGLARLSEKSFDAKHCGRVYLRRGK